MSKRITILTEPEMEGGTVTLQGLFDRLAGLIGDPAIDGNSKVKRGLDPQSLRDDLVAEAPEDLTTLQVQALLARLRSSGSTQDRDAVIEEVRRRLTEGPTA